MKIRFNQKKYVYPLIFFPALILFFFVYKSFNDKEEVAVVGKNELQDKLTGPSKDVVDANLVNKLTAYRQSYKEADGYTAITSLAEEKEEVKTYDNLYSDAEKRRIDSLESVLKERLEANNEDNDIKTHFQREKEELGESDEALLALINSANNPQPEQQQQKASEEKEPDALETMRKQMALIDSFQKANDPEYIEEQKQKAIKEALEKQRKEFMEKKSQVAPANPLNNAFNTLKPARDKSFIKAIIDENITGYSGSRIRIRLLEDIKVDNHLIKKGTCLYALVNGFSAQRVSLNISSVMLNGEIFQVNLDVYDLDGLKGLYVPKSAFRDFSKDLGAQTLQGVDLSSPSESSDELLQSGISSVYQSTSQAIAKAIRKNKAKIKNSSHIFLIDSQELNNNK